MKIVIKTNDLKRNINIRLPMSMVTTIIRFVNLSRCKYVYEEKVGSIFLKECNKNNITKGLNYLKKNHKDLVLVEVDSPNGEYVKIQI